MTYTTTCPNPSCRQNLTLDSSDPSLYKMFPLHTSGQQIITYSCGACSYAWPAVSEDDELWDIAKDHADNWIKQNLIEF